MDYPTADTYLHGLIRLVGKKANVEIISATGVSIDDAFFLNMREAHIISQDTHHYDECPPHPNRCARNIHLGPGKIGGDCPVFLYAKHFSSNGGIELPAKDLTLNI